MAKTSASTFLVRCKLSRGQVGKNTTPLMSRLVVEDLGHGPGLMHDAGVVHGPRCIVYGTARWWLPCHPDH